MNEKDSTADILAWLRARVHEGARLRLDSRDVLPGDVFVAVPGAHTDGRAFIRVAAARGAAGVLMEKRASSLPGEHYPVAALSVENLSARLGPVASGFYGEPTRRMTGVAVTGTNGKTTVTHWVAGLFGRLGCPTAVIGTLGAKFRGRTLASPHLTTPDALSFQGICADLAQAGAGAFAVEASSVGLDQGRLDGSVFETAVFTNLTHDHLDYHGTMAAYGEAKAKLMRFPGLKHAVVNLDDPAADPMISAALENPGVELWGTTVGDAAKVRLPTGGRLLAAKNVRTGPEGLMFTVAFEGETFDFASHFIGFFNVSNFLQAAAAAIARGWTFRAVMEAAGTLELPAGRMETLRSSGAPMGVVDYSHTPDSLQKALESLVPVARVRGGRLWAVFGFGGDRDPTKREPMMRIGLSLADQVILTSDNPRTEDPAAILAFARGVEGVEIVLDRREAILKAVLSAAPEDVVLVAGKGHEDYQEVMGVRHHFSDAEVVREAFNERRTITKNGAFFTMDFVARALEGLIVERPEGVRSGFSVTTDSRRAGVSTAFLAIRGAKRDGHDFVASAAASHAPLAIVSRRVEAPIPQLVVTDTVEAFGRLARAWRRALGLRVISVTGSNGKTTTTQMIAAMLKAAWGDAAGATAGNLNNEIGVPMTLLTLSHGMRAAVVEAGMNHPGELARLADWISPNIALVTNAQREHQEFMGGVRETAHENGLAIAALPERGAAVWPLEDACADVWASLARARGAAGFTFAADRVPGADLTAERTHGTFVRFRGSKRLPGGAFEAEVDFRAPGRHNRQNAAGALLAALLSGVPLEKALEALGSFRSLRGRGEVHELTGGGRLYDESYNANPDSVLAAMRLLAEDPAEAKIFILGAMREAGAHEREALAEVGSEAARLGIALWTSGEATLPAHEAFAAAGGPGARHFASCEAVLEAVAALETFGRTSVSVKASRTEKFERVTAALLGRFGRN